MPNVTLSRQNVELAAERYRAGDTLAKISKLLGTMGIQASPQSVCYWVKKELGLKRLTERRWGDGETTRKRTAARRSAWNNALSLTSDRFSGFLAQRCIVGAREMCYPGMAFGQFKAYLGEETIPFLSVAVLGTIVKRRGFSLKEKNGKRVWIGFGMAVDGMGPDADEADYFDATDSIATIASRLAISEAAVRKIMRIGVARLRVSSDVI